MSDTFCTVCGIDYYSVYCLKKHLTSKKHYKKANNIEGFPCECGKTYRSRQNRHNHRVKCRVYQELKKKKIADSTTTSSTAEYPDNNQLLLRIEQLEKDVQIKDLQNENLKNKLEIAQLKATNVTNNINKSKNTTNNITNNNNITINAFGDEKIDYITLKELIQFCNDKHFCIPNLIESTHFHPDHPENHNVRLPNKKLKYCQIMRDNKWKTIPKDDAYSDMKVNAFQELSDTHDKHQDKIVGFEEFREKFHNDKMTNKIIDERIDMLFSNKK